jgi:putative ABC transport system permease protein
MRATRALRSRPGFAAAAIGTLALGLGVNAAIFTLTRDILLRPLPYADADRLVFVSEVNPQFSGNVAPSVPSNYATWREQVDVFDLTAMFRAVDFNLADASASTRVKGFRVEPTFFPMFGVRPVLGRGFTPDDGLPGHDDVVLLSHGFWRRQFGADPAVIGRRVVVDGTPCTIVGVLPPTFKIFRVLNRELELWRPLVLDRADHERSIGVYARLRPGASVDTARAQVAAAFSSLPSHAQGWTADVSLLSARFAENARPILLVLEWAVGFVLLIACANVANMLLAVAASRQKELAVRSALGANRWRIARDLAGETFLLAAAGTVLGLVIAFWTVSVLNAVVSFQHINRLEPFRLDFMVVAYTAGVATVIALAFSILPARHAGAADVVEALKDSGHGVSAGRTGRTLRHSLIVAEIALSIVLLATALALTRSALELGGVQRGLEVERVMTAQLALNGPKYDDTVRMTQAADTIVSRLTSAAGIEAVSTVNYPPLSVIGTLVPLRIPGVEESVGREPPLALYWIVGPRYFTTVGIALITGREFSSGDNRDAAAVAIVSRRFAERFWGGTEVIGRQVTPLFASQSDAVWIPRTVVKPRTVVGVVEDVREDGIPGFIDERMPQLYLPYAQNPTRIITVVVRTAAAPDTTASLIRDAVRAADPEQPTFDERTLDEVRRSTFSRPRELAWLVGSFAALALVLAGVGVYAVMAYLTTARAREIGIRIALGAAHGDVVRMVVLEALRLAAWGVAIGLCVAPAALYFARAFLFGVAASDVAPLVAVAVIVTGVAAMAAAIPAHRAARTASASFR